MNMVTQRLREREEIALAATGPGVWSLDKRV